MMFGRYRIFLTVLAAFGGFFSYLCRLNLSLVIEEMVVKDVGPASASTSADDPAASIAAERDELARRLPDMRTEEQTFAELSAGIWWIKQKSLLRRIQLSQPKKVNRNATVKTRARAQVHPFSIEFDLSPKSGTKSSVNDDEAAQPGASTSDGQAAPQPNNDEPTTTTEATAEPTSEPTTEPAPNVPPAPLLNWGEDNKNQLLGAFFWGYVIFQVPAGRAAELFGPKLLMLMLGFGTALTSLAFPFAARFSDGGIHLAFFTRVIMGACQASLFPASYVFLCNWLPKSERSSWLAVPSAMGRFGTIAMNLFVPIIMLNYNWEWVFYASGLVTLVWALLVLVFSADRPSKSMWLSREELIYIESRMEPVSNQTSLPTGSALSLDDKQQHVSVTVARPGINWLKMLRSRALLMLTTVMFTSEWSNMLLLVKLPGFLGPVLNMGLDEIGYFSSALVLIFCIGYPSSGVLASRIEARQFSCMNSLRVRKLFEAMAQTLQAVGCLTLAFFQHKAIVLGALVTMMLGRSLVGGGQCLMPPELSKDYPGSVMAVANSLANCACIAGPFVLNYIVADPTSFDSWRNMWLLSAALFAIGGILFCWLADNRPQNYGRRPEYKQRSTSLANLVLPSYLPPPSMSGSSATRNGGQSKRGQLQPAEEIIRMGSFSRIAAEPQPTTRFQRRMQSQQQQQQHQGQE